MNTRRSGKAPLKTREIRTMVEMGMWRAVRLGDELLVPRRELQLVAEWQRHTWREREDDRLAWDEEEERKRRAQRWKREAERES